MKYKELSINLLRTLYKSYYNLNENKEKNFVMNIIISEENPNKISQKIIKSKFIPSGILEEKKTFNSKKSVLYDNYLLSKEKLPYSKNDKPPYKIYSILGKIQYNKNTEWINSSLAICRPKNILSNNCMTDTIWINQDDYTEKSIKNKEKKNKNRKSPIESATLFPIDTIKTGLDGNKWIIIETKNGIKRWKLFS